MGGVLIADDEHDIRILLRIAIESGGYDLDVVAQAHRRPGGGHLRAGSHGPSNRVGG